VNKKRPQLNTPHPGHSKKLSCRYQAARQHYTQSNNSTFLEGIFSPVKKHMGHMVAATAKSTNFMTA